MNKVLNRLPLTYKLLIIGALPLMVLLYFSYQMIKDQSERIARAEKNLVILSNYTERSKLVDQLHLERRASFNYLTGGDSLGARLEIQRAKTDELINKLRDNDGVDLERFKTFTLLNKLNEQRSLIDKKTLEIEQLFDFYNIVMQRVSGAVDHNLNVPDNLQLLLKSQYLVGEMAAQLGAMRSELYYQLLTERTRTNVFDRINGYYLRFKSFQTEILLKASPPVAKKITDLSRETSYKSTLTIIEHVISNSSTEGIKLSSEEWWEVSTLLTDKIRGLHNELLGELNAETYQLFKRENQNRNVTLGILIFIVVVVVLVVIKTLSAIIKVLNELKNAAEIISAGSTNVHLNIRSNDEIGILAKAINKVNESNKLLSNAAVAIGKGKFDIPIEPRGDEDTLGNALKQMRESLKFYAEENERKLWVQDGLTKINDSIREEKDITALSKSALITTVEYLNVLLATFYVREESDTFLFAGGYGISDDGTGRRIKKGEGLLGEAAETRRILKVDKVPNNYFKLSSSVGSALPNYLVIVPMMHNNYVEGVMELGSLEPFNEKQLELLDKVSHNVAIAIQSARSRAKLKELLKESETQKEELQTQHSELESINAELEAQTERLQTSEEELRVQQEELTEANKELEERSKLLEAKNQLILERNLDIQKKADELEQSSKYKSEFLANMSHELRTPLNSILLLSRLLSENNEKNLNGEQVEYASVINASGQGLLSLIDEILDLSKIEAGKMTLEFKSVSIEEIKRDMDALFSPIAKQKNLDFNVVIAESVPDKIITDKLRLEQILKNLISNSLKFTAKGSVNLEVNVPENGKDHITFSVIDTGIGIAKDKQKLIFEAFQQEDGSTKRKYGGTGLGLSISRDLANLLGGSIIVESEAGKGATFKLTVPQDEPVINEKEKTPAEKTDNISSASTSKTENNIDTEHEDLSSIPVTIEDDRNEIKAGDKSILIIEDDVHFSKALMRFAHSQGYKAIAAVRGDEGVFLARKYKPIGILLDINLPVKDGWQVMADLKTSKATADIPVHTMSSAEFKKESIEKGAIDFIDKTVALDRMPAVFSKIEEILKKGRKKVLIIEENPKHAEALAYYLESFNIKTEASKDIKHAFEKLKTKETDCVIIDIDISKAGKYEELEALKEEHDLKDVATIIFTGKNLSKAEEAKFQSYADSIVVKTAHSYQRVLDEVALFLHIVEKNREPGPRGIKRKSQDLDEVLKGKKVLITDDDVKNIFSLTKALEKQEMVVHSAIDGKEALKALNDKPDIDIVLMDIMMPEMDGYEAIKRIRSNPKTRNLPVIAVTAKTMSGDREKCIQAGANDYISKPIDIDQLVSLLRVWLYNKVM